MTRFKKPVFKFNPYSGYAGVATSLLVLLLVVLPTVTLMTGCAEQVKVGGDDTQLVSKNVTKGGREAIYPDDRPSEPDGKVIYEKLSCAECHGADGKGVAGKSTLDLTSKEYMRKQKPIDQYMFLAFGKDGLTHPLTLEKASSQQTWNLVYYVRSLATPLLPMGTKDYEQVVAVFGGNCAVCHGPKGYGDGPLNKYNVLEPNPANFQNYRRFYDRTDDVLYDHIANGIKWEGMPGFLNKEDKAKKVKFDEAYIWKLVAYVRAFHSTNKSLLAASGAEKDAQADSAKPDEAKKDEAKPAGETK
ncbi:MAG: c-type cytochrome [Candidatus Melainabacteria bacterium]|jgi:mono/diheme cytochrome c family protein|nr:c-type cytochrome [Candidatus Melainabacteria bacterium]